MVPGLGGASWWGISSSRYWTMSWLLLCFRVSTLTPAFLILSLIGLMP